MQSTSGLFLRRMLKSVTDFMYFLSLSTHFFILFLSSNDCVLICLQSYKYS
jgi:hypothetical protein